MESKQLLAIESVQGDDMGIITCSAENVVGRVSRDFVLVVNCKHRTKNIFALTVSMAKWLT